ncbi:hypothetical protein DFH27DRAFT_609063 [Peziza echinospora]|nr:hypothetical protein DFH27DRAFT_609063 [Peziza echinospora]
MTSTRTHNRRFFLAMGLLLVLMASILPVSSGVAFRPAGPLRKISNGEFTTSNSRSTPSIKICRLPFFEDCTTLLKLPGAANPPCTDVPKEFDERISSLEVRNGCCDFFVNGNCKGGLMFTSCNQQRQNLVGLANNQISSWRCKFENLNY